MRLKRSPLTFYRPIWPALLTLPMAFTVATITAAVMLFGLWPPAGWRGATLLDRIVFSKSATLAVLNEHLIGMMPLVRHLQKPAWTWLTDNSLAGQFADCWTLACVAGVVFTMPFGVAMYCLTPHRREARRIEGPRLLEAPLATTVARKAMRNAVRRAGANIELAPGLYLPREREIRSFLVVGAQRSGKTVFLRFLLRQLVTTSAKLIVHDTKGDMTACWPNDDFILLAPQDARSWGWDIGRDVNSELRATEFAAALVPEGAEAIWAQGARQIMTGIVVGLQWLHGTQWSWLDLCRVLQQPPDQLRTSASFAYPQAETFLARDPNGEFTKTAISYLNTLIAPLVAMIRPLAAAWHDLAPAYRLSLSEWLSDDYRGPRVLILQRMPAFAEMSRLWITASVNQMVSMTGGAGFPDSKTRRIWFVLDEFPQLGPIRSLFDLPATHAAKGITVALAMQSFAQAKKNYGPEAQSILSGLMGTKLIFRLESGDDADYASKFLVGTWRYRFPERTRRPKGTGWFQETNTDWRDRAEALLLPSYFGGLGPVGDGVDGLVVGLDGGDVHRLSWPYEDWPDQRPASVQAEWVGKIRPLPDLS